MYELSPVQVVPSSCINLLQGMVMFGQSLKQQIFTTTMVFASGMQYVWAIWCVLTSVVRIFVIMAIHIEHNRRGILLIHHRLGQCWIQSAHSFVNIASISLIILFCVLQRCTTFSISSKMSHRHVGILVFYAQPVALGECRDIVDTMRKLMWEEVSKSPSGNVSSIALAISKYWMSLQMLVPEGEAATTFDEASMSSFLSKFKNIHFKIYQIKFILLKTNVPKRTILTPFWS